MPQMSICLQGSGYTLLATTLWTQLLCSLQSHVPGQLCPDGLIHVESLLILMNFFHNHFAWEARGEIFQIDFLWLFLVAAKNFALVDMKITKIRGIVAYWQCPFDPFANSEWLSENHNPVNDFIMGPTWRPTIKLNGAPLALPGLDPDRNVFSAYPKYSNVVNETLTQFR